MFQDKFLDECDCDGYHTWNELYEHRIVLFIALCEQIERWWDRAEKPSPVWRSKLHSDGSSLENWFIMGIFHSKGDQMTYHVPFSKWKDTNFVATLEKAPEYDGHTPDNVLERLKKL